ncbi:MAG TPA: hypothetical protein VG777_08435, partial [Thermoanaerobaculia bacterium]|nr:hypothetical protein [Thermoanaerobaculia bacterium]
MTRDKFSLRTAIAAAAVAGLLALPISAQTSSGTTTDDNYNTNTSSSTTNDMNTRTDTNATTRDTKATTSDTDRNATTGTNTTSGTLPRTASPVPLAALLGLGLIAGGAGLRAR